MRRRLLSPSDDTVRAFLAIRVPLVRSADPSSGSSHGGAAQERVAPDGLDRVLLLRLLAEFVSMGRSVRAVAADAVHLTLKFFGDLPEDRIQEASEVITSVVETTPGFELQLRGLGAFPSERRPSVIWVGISGGEACTRLVEKLELALGEAGFPHATRSFQPHVTLARVKARPPARLTEILSERANTAFGGFRVDQIELIASELTSTGPIYSLLGRFRPGLAAT